MPLKAPDTKSIVTPERGRPASPRVTTKKVIENQKAAIRTATGPSVPATQRSKQAPAQVSAQLVGKRTRMMAQALKDAENDAPVQQVQKQSQVVVPVTAQPSGVLSIKSVTTGVQQPVHYGHVSERKPISIASIVGNNHKAHVVGLPKKT